MNNIHLPQRLSGKKNLTAKQSRLIPGLRISPAEANGNTFKYSYLGNSMDRGAWKAAIHGITKSQALLNN